MKRPFIYLSPMAGVGDAAMRIMCHKYGADLSVTEMVSAAALKYGDKKTFTLAKTEEREGPVAVQVFGHEPDTVAYAIQTLYDKAVRKPVFFDINMGCPVKKIVSSGDGSALMKDLPLAERVLSAAVKASPIPVTVKMRTGFSKGEFTARELAKRAEAAGVAAICVHGRTREDMYTEKTVRRDLIAEVKRSVSVPVFANGDVFSASDAIGMLKDTGCDGIAVARGALGNPFIFTEIKQALEGGGYEPPDTAERIRAAKEHLSLIVSFKGEKTGVMEARKHMGWYTKGLPGAARARLLINSAGSYEEITEILDALTEGTV